MRDVDRQITCSNLNNELRAANIKLNAALRRKTDAENTTRHGPSEISGYEYQITEINTKLAALGVIGFGGRNPIGLATAGEVAKLESRKRKLQEKIAQRQRDIQAAQEELIKVKQIIELQQDIIAQTVAEKNQLGC